jgi:hypothetical protein
VVVTPPSTPPVATPPVATPETPTVVTRRPRPRPDRPERNRPERPTVKVNVPVGQVPQDRTRVVRCRWAWSERLGRLVIVKGTCGQSPKRQIVTEAPESSPRPNARKFTG